ncbi:hypothetical protein HMPREF9622_02770 [Cutibacterium modestum HL037PA3]|uniref:Uncharacterized protein n=1 Tax=Cutibacterium modestum HL044PA1 TaxID=765109 RepID=A0ABP2K9L1_9ACTN|nr:hypothetical protein HMPREF9621_02575 [Cutibacterium modestum HL037PA2]EFS92321.1 hypothetical protein HMPREF9607_01664 [Cutibacterium modestum HL044PA1]EFT14199.1 hypothetical protein HMPREF9622_02770 [Cutibacterium modestum HL037PA3]EGG26467.1 hypothetical protein PA08_1620 [Cutibacterium modestum P08]
MRPKSALLVAGTLLAITAVCAQISSRLTHLSSDGSVKVWPRMSVAPGLSDLVASPLFR